MQRYSVGIVVVNYCTPHLTLACIQSLINGVGQAGRVSIVVVDNASPDDSLDCIRPAEHHNGVCTVELIASERNGGFAAGCNIGIRRLQLSGDTYDYIWLVNPDTCVSPGALDALVERMDTHSAIGIVGSKLLDSAGTVQVSAFRFHTLLSEFVGAMQLGVLDALCRNSVVAPTPRGHGHQTHWVSGASMLIRRELIQEVGLLDEGYFLYFEEVDYCARAWEAGWAVWYEPKSQVMHLEGQSTNIKTTSRRPVYWFQSRKRYFTKHYGRCGAIAADILWITGRLMLHMRSFIQRKAVIGPPWLLHDFVAQALRRRSAQ